MEKMDGGAGRVSYAGDEQRLLCGEAGGGMGRHDADKRGRRLFPDPDRWLGRCRGNAQRLRGIRGRHDLQGAVCHGDPL